MSVCEDRKNRRYYISYHISYPDGTTKTVNIKKKEWSFDRVGKRYRRSIEASEIEFDKRKRLGAFSLGARDVRFPVLCQEYVREMERTLKRQTAYAKSHIVSKHILPRFRPEADLATSLSPETCRLFKEALWAEELSAEHKSRILRVMREIVAFAADSEFVTYESSKKMQRVLAAPRISVCETPEHSFWTVAEYDAFRATFTQEKDWKWGVFFDVVYFGALRLGEALALKWKWVNFGNGTVFVAESLDNSGIASAPKNASSRASVSLPGTVMEELKALKEALLSSDEDYVFFHRKSSRTTVRRVMDAHMKQAGVKEIRVHDLRHSMASRLINLGVNPLIVSKHLRHSSTQQTLDTYSHLFPNATDGLMDRLFATGGQETN